MAESLELPLDQSWDIGKSQTKGRGFYIGPGKYGISGYSGES